MSQSSLPLLLHHLWQQSSPWSAALPSPSLLEPLEVCHAGEGWTVRGRTWMRGRHHRRQEGLHCWRGLWLVLPLPVQLKKHMWHQVTKINEQTHRNKERDRQTDSAMGYIETGQEQGETDRKRHEDKDRQNEGKKEEIHFRILMSCQCTGLPHGKERRKARHLNIKVNNRKACYSSFHKKSLVTWGNTNFCPDCAVILCCDWSRVLSSHMFLQAPLSSEQFSSTIVVNDVTSLLKTVLGKFRSLHACVHIFWSGVWICGWIRRKMKNHNFVYSHLTWLSSKISPRPNAHDTSADTGTEKWQILWFKKGQKRKKKKRTKNETEKKGKKKGTIL